MALSVCSVSMSMRKVASSRQRVSIWIYEGQLRIEYQQTIVARYRCDYDAGRVNCTR